MKPLRAFFALALSASLGIAGCGGDDDDGAPADAAIRAEAAIEHDAGPPQDAGRELDASVLDAARDAEIEPDSSMDAEVAEDAGPAPSEAGQPVDPATGLLGVWEVVGFEDSSGPFMAVPPGRFLVFDASHVYLACADAMGLPYELRPAPGGFVSVHVDLGGGSSVDWVIVELTTSAFVFVEGGDRFFHERRDACP